MINELDISKLEKNAILRKCSGIDDHFDISHVFEISKFNIAGLTSSCSKSLSNEQKSIFKSLGLGAFCT